MHLYIVHIVTISAGYIRMSWYADGSRCLFMGVTWCVPKRPYSVGRLNIVYDGGGISYIKVTQILECHKKTVPK
jgi:hypothetical protein